MIPGVIYPVSTSIAVKPFIAGLMAILPAAVSHGSVFTFAEYHLGEAGSLETNPPYPLNSNGYNRHFNTVSPSVSGSVRWTVVNSVPAAATGSTAGVDTSAALKQGADFYSYPGGPIYPGGPSFPPGPPSPLLGLPGNNFAFGIFARAPESSLTAGGNVFATGSCALSLGPQGWRAQAATNAFIRGQAGNFTADTWVHLALIRANNETRFYINGVDQGGASFAEPSHNFPTLAGSSSLEDFNGMMDEARVVTFSPGEPVANILAALQAATPCTAFITVGSEAAVKQANLSTAETSIFRMGGAVRDQVQVMDADGLSVAGAEPEKHRIRIVSEGPIAAGRYPLISYSGAIGGQGLAGLELLPLPGRTAGTLELNAANTAIELVVGVSQAVTWTGTGSNLWDVSSGGNWVLEGIGTATSYLEGDSVIFNDSSAATDNSVVIPETVAPYMMKVDGSENYSFTGAGITGSTSLTKTGSGTLTLANDNSFTGPVTINGGTLRLGNGGATGSLGSGSLALNNCQLLVDRSGDVTLASAAFSGSGSVGISKTGPGRLILPSSTPSFTGAVTLNAGEIVAKRSNPFPYASLTIAPDACLDTSGFGIATALTVSGHGVDGQGAIKGNVTANSGFYLAGDTTIAGGLSAAGLRSDWDNSVISRRSVSANYKLNLRGSLNLTLTDFNIKDVDIDGGSMILGEGTVVSGSPADVVTIRNGGGLYMSSPFPVSQQLLSYQKPTFAKSLVLNNGTLSVNGAYAGYSLPGNIEINGPNNKFIAEASHPPTSGQAAMSPVSLLVKGTVSGDGSLTTDGYGSVSLSKAPAYTGNTTIHTQVHSVWPQYIHGSLSLGGPGLNDSSTVSIDHGAYLILNFTGTDTVAKLIYAGIQLPAGVYSSDPAAYPPGPTAGGVVGPGTLTVTTGPTDPPYRQWETLQGIPGVGANVDSDGDGIPNGIEFVIGGDPSGPNSNSRALLPVITSTATSFQVVYRRHFMSALGGYPDKVRYGSDFSTDWATAENNVAGVTINTEPDAFDIGVDRVTVTIPKAGKPKLFVALQADIP